MLRILLHKCINYILNHLHSIYRRSPYMRVILMCMSGMAVTRVRIMFIILIRILMSTVFVILIHILMSTVFVILIRILMSNVLMSNVLIHEIVLLLFKRNTIGHIHNHNAVIKAVYYRLSPYLHILSCVYEHITLPYLNHVRRAQIIRMALHPRRKKKRHISIIAGYLPCKIILRK